MIISQEHINEVEILTGENDFIKFKIAPAAGGKILSIYNKQLGKEFLWRNENIRLQTHQDGADYDANFYGGIDELIPNDIPENVDAVDYPDHGELWTTPLEYEIKKDSIAVFGKLKLSSLYYKKTVTLDAKAPLIHLHYKIKNESGYQRNFLWKLHAALSIKEGDKIVTTAQKAKVVDPAYSRFSNLNEFDWPVIECIDASIVPVKNNSTDFFYLYDIEQPEMKFLSDKDKHLFSYQYDKKVFPYQWYFASYGGFLNHYTVILEPCSGMPMSVNDAKDMGKCTVLKPNEEINTVVSIYAGENNL